MNSSETIFALSSGVVPSGIAIVRVSGGKAKHLLESIAGKAPPARHASLRKLKHPGTREIIDEALVWWSPGPHSSTGEDVAEFHTHGSAAVVQALFDVLRHFDGVRLAEPGEFSRRALINDRMDLVEVEGLADLLQARTEAQRRQAVRHSLGEASAIYEHWRGEIIAVLSLLEAAIDFVEEEGVAETAFRQAMPRAQDLKQTLVTAVAAADRADALRRGLKIVIAGPPNAGKSSLLNRLALREAAIVSSRAGTTRDVIEVGILMGGVPVVLTDTAGLRPHTDDDIEEIGMARARREADSADVLIWVTAPDAVDSGEPPAAPDLWVLNKADLLSQDSIPSRNDDGRAASLELSVKTGAGMAAFDAALARLIQERIDGGEDAIIVRTRQKHAVEESIRWLNDALSCHPDHIELAAECLRKAATALGRVTGRIDVEDLLDHIFREFCIGK
jgi:tRNA modification GTPase